MKKVPLGLDALVKTSRPIVWIGTAAPFFIGYLLATQSFSWPLLVGALYFTFPYNLLLHGIEDMYGRHKEPKSSQKSRAKHKPPDKSKSRTLWYIIAAVNLPFLIYLFSIGDWSARAVLLLVVGLCFSYGMPPLRFKEIPFLDSFNYSLLLVGPLIFGLVLGGANQLYLPALVAFLLWGMASQAFGAIRYIKRDRAARVRSIATSLGAKRTTTYSLVLYSAAAVIIGIAYLPSGLIAAALLGLYVLNVSFFRKYRSDAYASLFRRGWHNFIWFNALVGFGLGLVLLFLYDPLGLHNYFVLIISVTLLTIFALQSLLIAQNLIGFRRKKTPRLNDWPRVSILVHAYNQADNISSTLLAALGQNYPDFEIVFGDLGSTDNTAKIASGYQDPRLRIENISPTKAGWTVNTWAAQQLLEQAHGEIIVLISADTILLPNALSTTVSLLESERLDLVSILPADQNKTIAQQLILSQNHFLLLGAYPAYLLTKKWPKFSSAYSGLMVFRKDKSHKLNGFASVRNSPLEDFELAASAAVHGLKTGFYLGSDIATSQNHAALQLILSQNSRRFYPTLLFSAPLTISLSLGGLFLFVMPILLVIGLFLSGNYADAPLLLIAIGLSFANRFAITVISRQSILSTILYPVGCTIVLVQLITSMLNYELLRPRWHNRREAF